MTKNRVINGKLLDIHKNQKQSIVTYIKVLCICDSVLMKDLGRIALKMPLEAHYALETKCLQLKHTLNISEFWTKI